LPAHDSQYLCKIAFLPLFVALGVTGKINELKLFVSVRVFLEYLIYLILLRHIEVMMVSIHCIVQAIVAARLHTVCCWVY